FFFLAFLQRTRTRSAPSISLWAQGSGPGGVCQTPPPGASWPDLTKWWNRQTHGPQKAGPHAGRGSSTLPLVTAPHRPSTQTWQSGQFERLVIGCGFDSHLGYWKDWSRGPAAWTPGSHPGKRWFESWSGCLVVLKASVNLTNLIPKAWEESFIPLFPFCGSLGNIMVTPLR